MKIVNPKRFTIFVIISTIICGIGLQMLISSLQKVDPIGGYWTEESWMEEIQ